MGRCDGFGESAADEAGTQLNSAVQVGVSVGRDRHQQHYSAVTCAPLGRDLKRDVHNFVWPDIALEGGSR